jgi:MFS family permease
VALARIFPSIITCPSRLAPAVATKTREISLHSFRTFTAGWPFLGLQISSAAMNLSHALAAVLYPWVMYQISGSIFWTTAIAAVTVSLLLAGLVIGGFLAEFVGFRDVALSASNLAALMALAVAALYAADLLTPTLFLTLAVMGAILGGPATIAIETRLPEIARFSKVSPHQASIVDDVVDGTVLVGSPVVAGYLLTTAGVLGLMWAIAVLSVIALAFLSLSLPRFRLAAAPKLRDTFEGFQWLKGVTRASHSFLGGSFALGFFITLQIFLVPAALAIDDMPAELLGLFLSGAAAGMIVVNIVLATSTQRHANNDVTSAALLGLAASVAMLAFNMSPLMLLAAGLVAGFSGGLLSPIYAAILRVRAPRRLRSPVLGLAYAALLVFLPGEMLVVGILISAASLKTAFVISALGLLVVALIYHCWIVD